MSLKLIVVASLRRRFLHFGRLWLALIDFGLGRGGRGCVIVAALSKIARKLDKTTGSLWLITLSTLYDFLVTLNNIMDSELSSHIIIKDELDALSGSVYLFSAIIALVLLNRVVFRGNLLHILIRDCITECLQRLWLDTIVLKHDQESFGPRKWSLTIVALSVLFVEQAVLFLPVLTLATGKHTEVDLLTYSINLKLAFVLLSDLAQAFPIKNVVKQDNYLQIMKPMMTRTVTLR